MRPEDLQQFVAMLDQAGELTRVSSVVDPHLEVAAVVNAVCKSARGNRALLFASVAGHSLPLAANLYGSPRRMAMALGVEDSAAWPQKLRAGLAASGADDSLRALEKLLAGSPQPAVYVDNAPCHELDITACGLAALPALQAWPGDGGRYLTLGQVFTCHPESLVGNCGMYRLQIVDRHKLLLRCHPGSGGARHLAAWHAGGQAMPIAIVLGGPPIMTWLAGVPLPGGVTETALAGYLTGQPIPLCRCLDTRLAVPARAEIVLEGRLVPGETMLEGPFGNHTGRYQPAAPAPVIRVESIRMREGAIYPCTVVGPPPMENSWLAAMTEALLLPLLQFDHPWVHDLHMPQQGIFHRAAMVAVSAGCPLSVEAMGEALRRATLLQGARLLVLLDGEVRLRDFADVYWRVVNAPGWPDSCHVEAAQVILDARSPNAERRVGPDLATARKLRARWHEYGLDSDLRPDPAAAHE